jgi:hypothetical protein
MDSFVSASLLKNDYSTWVYTDVLVAVMPLCLVRTCMCYNVATCGTYSIHYNFLFL